MAGTYKDILARFKKDLGNSFQAQKNIVDVSQKYIGLLEDAEGESSEHIYSTTPQKIGKWIDGSDLYEQVYTGTMPSLVDTPTTIVNIGEGKSIIDFWGYVNQERPIDSYQDTNSYAITWIRSGKYTIGTQCKGSIYLEKDFYIVVRYIKTTA